MRYLRGTWMRGGTSKCWLFDAEDLAGGDPGEVLAAAFGAGDPRQIDGVGGATSTTSKAALVRRSGAPGIDVDYRFAQVGIGARRVEWGSNCGNCATAIGLYALLTGLIEPERDRTTVRMRNTNTGTLLAAGIATPGGVVPETGTAVVPGAGDGGVPVELAFLDPSGSTTGVLSPTGRPLDRLPVPATLVDAGAPAALIDADAAGDLTVDELIALRRKAAVVMGLSGADDAIPKTGLVGRPRDPGHDLHVRMVSMLAPHPAVGLTSAVAITAAAGVEGSVVHRALGGRVPGVLRLGTPAGVVTVRAEWDSGGRLRAVRLDRAARRIAVAEISVPLTEDVALAS
ncbi:PrpF domain-containing protein [Amycolatopsis alkalitolerans]|uniref:PrpF, AcnD-accessory n=1 Tax=Amycolatopsis alkalitolerans TaxID=2547244 RepID=A0A5C4LSE7_9PSEU|nr:PrpF domain-containing protein [Amycolatopsis alkalitolerans]TNC21891.1 PrpF, AcnD-accessory [Amycolatopsis alkalitolerans]